MGRPRPARAAGKSDGSWSPGPAMTVVAHPDDDLFFINPSIRATISAGAPVVSVVLTAAEGDGINVFTRDPDRDGAPVDYDGYAAARRVGLRRAYARMAGLPVDSVWKRELIELDAGWTVERDMLVAAAAPVTLYFLTIGHVWVDGSAQPTLLPLCDDELDEVPTMPAVDLPAPVQQVTKAMIVDALAELIQAHRPTVVRTLDPDPEHDWGRAQYTVSDHLDHTATARLTFLAVQRYAEEHGPETPVMEYFRGYANRFWPRNCSDRVRRDKRDFLLTYAGADGEPHPGYPHGDYQIGPEPYLSSHIFSTAERYVATATWLAPLPSGALAAFAVRGDRLVSWVEDGPGSGRWSGPVVAGEPGLMPTLSVAARPGGPVYVAALRRAEKGKGVIDVEVGHFTVDGTDRRPHWTSLAGPDTADPDRRRQREVGVPAITVDGHGRLWIFVREFTGELSVRRQTTGGWQPWARLGDGPTPLQDVLTATTTEAGLVEVYAASKRTVASWRQTAPGGPLVANNALTSTPVASGGLTVSRTGGDRSCLYFRQAETGTILAYREHVDAGRWPGQPAELGGHDGLGPIAVLPRRTAGALEAVLAQRNRFWTASVAVPPAGHGSRWRRLPGMISGAPALAADHRGRGVLAVLGLDGRLHVCRQETADTSSAFGGWTAV